jgi:hypothetical protein
VALGGTRVLLVVVIILLQLDRIPRIIDAFRALSEG